MGEAVRAGSCCRCGYRDGGMACSWIARVLVELLESARERWDHWRGGGHSQESDRRRRVAGVHGEHAWSSTAAAGCRGCQWQSVP